MMRFFGIKHRDSSRKTRSSLSEQIASAGGGGVKEDRVDHTNTKKDGGKSRDSSNKEVLPAVESRPVPPSQQSHAPSRQTGGLPVSGKSPSRQAASPRGSHDNNNNMNPVPLSRTGSAPGPSRQHSPAAAAAAPSRPKSTAPEVNSKPSSNPKPRLDLINEPSSRNKNASPKNHPSMPVQNIVKETNGAKTPPKAKGPPPSILHKNAHYTAKAGQTPTRKKDEKLASPSPTPGTPKYSFPSSNPTPHQNNRVRFLSSSSSVTSTEASEVHLMAGAGSVASSAMSSTKEGSENIFDKVLNQVMAEEEKRLNAMGMSRSGSFRGSSHPKFVTNAAYLEDDNNSLGLTSPNCLAPIDVDTGLEVGSKNKAPIDVDTGMEIHFNNIDDDYHDMNDDEVDDSRWNMLNETALNISQDSVEVVDSGLETLDLNTRRVRSFDTTRQHQHQPVNEPYHRASSQGSERTANNRVTSPSDLKAKRTYISNEPQHNIAPPSKNTKSDAIPSWPYWATGAELATPSKGVLSPPSGKESRRHDAPNQRSHEKSGAGRAKSHNADKWTAFGGQGPTTDSLTTF